MLPLPDHSGEKSTRRFQMAIAPQKPACQCGVQDRVEVTLGPALLFHAVLGVCAEVTWGTASLTVSPSGGKHWSYSVRLKQNTQPQTPTQADLEFRVY